MLISEHLPTLINKVVKMSRSCGFTWFMYVSIKPWDAMEIWIRHDFEQFVLPSVHMHESMAKTFNSLYCLLIDHMQKGTGLEPNFEQFVLSPVSTQERCITDFEQFCIVSCFHAGKVYNRLWAVLSCLLFPCRECV